MENRQEILESKIDCLFEKLSASAVSTSLFLDDDDQDKDTRIIKMMASSRESVRAKVNYKQCLSIMGFPISSSVEDVSVYC